MHDIGNLGYDYNYSSYATAINNNGQVVGYAATPDHGYVHAFLYSSGSMYDIGTFPGGEQTFAYGINNNGQIVGAGDIAGSHNGHAFLYANGQMSDLGTLGGDYSQANGINDNGQIVGVSQVSDITGVADAFLYSNGSMVDLNSLIGPNSGWTLESATAINDSGQIVGYGINAEGQDHAFLLEMIPEPSMLLPLGLATLVVWRRR
jgi:probable HAF family extracellular repeat protein